MSTPLKAIIFDGDDTLWECGQYYREAEEKFFDAVTKRTGLPYEFCKRMFQLIDGQMATLPDGFAKDRFPTVFEATSMALDVMSPNPTYILTDAQDAYNIGNSIYNEDYPLYPCVKVMLFLMKCTNTKLILNTKGDYEVQDRKVKINRIRNLFDDVVITLKKDKSHLQAILEKYDLRPEEVLCVGDSVVDDILVPQSLGCKTVWISDVGPIDFEPSWVYEEGVGQFCPDWWTASVASMLDILNVQDTEFVEFMPLSPVTIG